MGSTGVNGIPYPEQTQQPTVPADLKALADAAARGGVMRFANAAARTAYFNNAGISPSEGMFSDLADLDEVDRYDGTTWQPMWVVAGAKPAAEIRQTVLQSIPAGNWTALTFDVEDLDSHGGHDNVTNNTRYTAVKAGWYSCGGGWTPVVSASGERGVRWAVNGTGVNGSNTFLPATGALSAGYPARVKKVFLNVGDFVELQVYQDTAGALNTVVALEAQSSMSISFDRVA